MGSPDSSQDFTNPTQDSPMFSKTSDQSPARPFIVPLRFGLDSPRHQFMSPRVIPHYQRTPLVRTNFTEPSGATISAQDEGCNNSLPSGNGSGNDQIERPSANPGKFLADTVSKEFVNPNNSPHSARKQSEHIDQPPKDDVAGEENVIKLGHEYNAEVKVEKTAFAPHALINQDPGDFMPEAFRHHEMHRSYLQFEDAQNKLETNWHSQIHLEGEGAKSLSSMRQQTPFNIIQSIPYPKQYLHPRPTMGIAKPSSSCLQQFKTNGDSQIHSDGEGARLLSLEKKQTPFNTIQPVSYPELYLDPTPIMSIPKPSSSGLQLDNVFNSGATVNMKYAQMGSFSLQGRKSKHLFKPMAKSLLREITYDNSLKSLLYAHFMKSSKKYGVLNPVKDRSTQADKKKLKSENVGDKKKFNRPKPKRGRKQKSEPNSGDACIITCQCKKINCMKLYCECFTASVFCAETCSCQGCLNIKECDDEVLEARELIESRNPLAFAPKVVQHSIKPSASGYREDGTSLPPSSARHIRGCNCKKSMCAKKYCDCYQSRVRCSDGCRCVGCQNTYGRKGGEKGIIDPLSGEENNQRTDSIFDSFYTPAPANESHNTYLGTDQNSTPLGNILKDEQAERLEDTPMSLNTIKVGTQNKKRVCPPPDPVQEYGSSSPKSVPK